MNQDTLAPWTAPLGAVPYNIESFRASDSPDIAIGETVGRMSRHVSGAISDPAITRAVHDAGADASGLTATERASRMFWWIRQHVKFVQDPPGDEFLIGPPALLAMNPPAGDCDDQAMLAATMLTIVGIRTRFVTVAADPSDQSRFSHVYLEAQTERGWMPFDASHGAYPGWSAEEAGPVWRHQRWPLLLAAKPARRPATLGGLGRLGQGIDPEVGLTPTEQLPPEYGRYPVYTPGGTGTPWSTTFTNIFGQVAPFVSNLVRMRTPTYRQTPTGLETFPTGQVPSGFVSPIAIGSGQFGGLFTILLIGGVVFIAAKALGGGGRR